MKIVPFLSTLCVFSVGLVFFGGATYALWPLVAYVAAAIGAGWLAIIYSFLLRNFRPSDSVR